MRWRFFFVVRVGRGWRDFFSSQFWTPPFPGGDAGGGRARLASNPSTKAHAKGARPHVPGWTVGRRPRFRRAGRGDALEAPQERQPPRACCCFCSLSSGLLLATTHPQRNEARRGRPARRPRGRQFGAHGQASVRVRVNVRRRRCARQGVAGGTRTVRVQMEDLHSWWEGGRKPGGRSASARQFRQPACPRRSPRIVPRTLARVRMCLLGQPGRFAGCGFRGCGERRAGQAEERRARERALARRPPPSSNVPQTRPCTTRRARAHGPAGHFSDTPKRRTGMLWTLVGRRTMQKGRGVWHARRRGTERKGAAHKKSGHRDPPRAPTRCPLTRCHAQTHLRRRT